MVPSIIDVWGYDRVLFIFFFSSKSHNSKTEKHEVMKFCKNVDIHNAKRLHIFIFGLLILLAVNSLGYWDMGYYNGET